MPFAALALALLVLSSPFEPATAGSSAKRALAAQPPASLLLAFDDEARGNRADEEDPPYAEDPNFNYGYEGDDDEDNSAHGPGDDDDGWDVDDSVRSERA